MKFSMKSTWFTVLMLTLAFAVTGVSCGGGGTALPVQLARAVKAVDAALQRGDPEATCAALSEYAKAVVGQMMQSRGRAAALLSRRQETAHNLALSCRHFTPEQLKRGWQMERRAVLEIYQDEPGTGTAFLYVGIFVGVLLLAVFLRRARQSAGG